MTPQDLLAAGYRMGRAMIHRMVDDLTDEDFRHQPVPGANSAAWVVGHLALTARRAAERLGVADLPAVAPELAARFATTRKPAEPQPDLGGKDELLALFDACIDKLAAGAQALPAEALTGPSAAPGPFATNFGEGVLFGAMHVMLHAGQLSTIRRSLGKPPVV